MIGTGVRYYQKGSFVRTTNFFLNLAEQVDALGGYLNGHTHLDRSHTLAPAEKEKGTGSGHLSLMRKHALISEIHQGAFYTRENLKS